MEGALIMGQDLAKRSKRKASGIYASGEGSKSTTTTSKGPLRPEVMPKRMEDLTSEEIDALAASLGCYRVDEAYRERSKNMVLQEPGSPDPESDSWRNSDTDDSAPRWDMFWRDTKETYDQPMLQKDEMLFLGTGVQVFSVRIIRADIVSNANDEFLVYGSARARDNNDFARNYIFLRQSTDAIRATVGDTIPLTGPRRGIAPIGRVSFEFNLNAKGTEGHSKGKPISKDKFQFDTEYMDECQKQKVLTRIVRGKHGAVEVKYAIFTLAAAAVVEIVPTSGARHGLSGRISACILGLKEDESGEAVSENEITLLDTEKYNEFVSYEGSSEQREVIKLWSRLVVVPKDCKLRLTASFVNGSGHHAAATHVFTQSTSGRRHRLKFGFAEFTARVSWAPLLP